MTRWHRYERTVCFFVNWTTQKIDIRLSKLFNKKHFNSIKVLHAIKLARAKGMGKSKKSIWNLLKHSLSLAISFNWQWVRAPPPSPLDTQMSDFFFSVLLIWSNFVLFFLHTNDYVGGNNGGFFTVTLNDLCENELMC